MAKEEDRWMGRELMLKSGTRIAEKEDGWLSKEMSG
jgi:hypothetical protein